MMKQTLYSVVVCNVKLAGLTVVPMGEALPAFPTRREAVEELKRDLTERLPKHLHLELEQLVEELHTHTDEEQLAQMNGCIFHIQSIECHFTVQ